MPDGQDMPNGQSPDLRPSPGNPPPEGVPAGLSTVEAAHRLAIEGPNVLPGSRRRHTLLHLVAQLTHFFAILLWAAAILAVVAGMPVLGAAIAAVVVINGIFAWAQEARANRAAEQLRDLLPHRCTVIRDGVAVSVDAAGLVHGDLVRLEAGDRVSADLTVNSATALAVDTSTLTGETVPERPAVGDVVHAGTFVTSGDALATVTATGGATRLAAIATLTTSRSRPRTPLAVELDRVVRRIAIIAIGVGVGFFGVALALGTDPAEGFLFAIGVTVALVPEGLLPTITLALAVGAQRMAARRGLVRRLDAVETLGATTVICTDKTGTLTRNQMSAVAVWTPSGTARITGDGYQPVGAVVCPVEARSALGEVARAARTCSVGRAVLVEGAWSAQGDPMEAAIDSLAHRCAAVHDERVVEEIPFDPRRRRMSVVVERDGRRLLICKGAPEAVLSVCDAGSRRNIGGAADGGQADAGAPALESAAEALAAEGLRVLAVAVRNLDPDEVPDVAIERELTPLGLIGFEDPPRDHITEAIARCRAAGIKVIMLTGDHPVTALAIARRIGLSRPDVPPTHGSPGVVGGAVMLGTDLPEESAAIGAMVDVDGLVISRVSPEQKLSIALALQERHHVVAMTGDGVNDGPALQAADVGVAMGASGTDVAREAADLVLLDDHFATIVEAVDQGRVTYANIRRFLTYHLTDNVAELTPFAVWALSGGRIPLAIGVLQVLCLDIGTDLLPALALGAEPAHRLEGPLAGHDLIDRPLMGRVFGVLGPVEAVMEMLAFLTVLLGSGWHPGRAQPPAAVLATASGAAFTTVVVAQMANALACRSRTQPVWRMPVGSNPRLLLAIAVEVLVLVGFLGIPPVARALGGTWPSAPGLLVALLSAPVLIGVDGWHKARIGRREAPEARGAPEARHHPVG